MVFDFEGRRVLVTGGAQGLGHSIVKKFYESGATVFVLDYNKEACTKLKNEFPKVKTICADLSNPSDVADVIEKCGKLDHLVNNAGVYFFEPLLEMSEDIFNKTMDINFKSPFQLSQKFCKNVIVNSTKGATIVNISSIAEKTGTRGSAVYGCSKAALSMMTKCFAVEMGEFGIRANSVGPGVMSTQMFQSLPDELREGWKSVIERQPIPGFIDPNDVANLVMYLSSPYSQMISGCYIPVDGGLIAA